MENRTLVIADELFGENGEAATRFSELLLCSEPARPLQFVLNAPLPYPFPSLFAKIAFDIIGKQAKRIVLGVGLHELARGGNADELFASFKSIVQEVLLKTTSYIYLVTIPLDALPQIPSVAQHWNMLLREFAKGLDASRVKLADFALHLETFKEEQLARGKFARTLYTDAGKATSMCLMLLALYLQQVFAQSFTNQNKVG